MHPAPKRISPGALLLVLAAITLVGLGLRLPSFGASLFGDEVSTYGIVSGHGIGTVLDLVRSDLENTPPLFYLLAWISERLFGAPEGLRLVSLVAGVAAIPLTYLLGTQTVGRRAALVGAALIAVSPFLIFYSTEARAYALVMLLVLLSTLALLRAVERGGTTWWVSYAALACVAMYAHYAALFVLAAQFGWAFLAHPGSRRPLLLASAAAAVAYLPWLPGLVEDSNSPTYLYDNIAPLDLTVAREGTLQWGIGHPVLDTDLNGSLGIWMLVAGLAVGTLGLVARQLGQGPDERSWRPSPEVALVIALALAAPLGAVAYSLVGSDIFTARNLIGSWPGLALAVGTLLTAGRAWVSGLAVALYLGGLTIAGARMLDADNRHPDYEGVVEFIDESGPPGSPIAEIAPATWGPQTALEAALGSPHDVRPGGHPVLEVDAFSAQGFPPLAARHRFLHSNTSIFVWAPLTRHRSAAEQGVRAGRLARGGPIFFVGFDQVQTRYGLLPAMPPESFLLALPSGYRIVESRTFPGLAEYSPRVWILRRVPGSTAGD